MMYDQVKQAKQRKDLLLPAVLIIAAILVLSVTPTIATALRASSRYHSFIQTISHDLTLARRTHGTLLLSEDGEERPVTADSVSNTLVAIADCGLGKLLRNAPDAPSVSVLLPNGAKLTLYNTPENTDGPIPIGVTVQYDSPGEKTFLYLQRDLRYEELLTFLHNGAAAAAEQDGPTG